MGRYLLRHAGVTGGGAFVPGRVLLVTAARKKGYARAPAVLLKAPGLVSGVSGDASGDETSTPGVCLVLLPDCYIPQEKESDKPATLNFVGTSHGRHYTIQEVELGEILLISSVKHKIDVKTLYKDTSSSLVNSSSMKASSFFGKPMKREVDDPFANFVSSGKKGLSSNTTSSTSSSFYHAADQIVTHLLTAEKVTISNPPEDQDLPLPPLDLQTCLKSVHQGTHTLQFRSLISQTHNLLTSLHHGYPVHRHPDLLTHYAAVEKKETLRDRVGTLRHLLSDESLRLFPDFLQRKNLLRTLGYISQDDDTVGIKGRVACEVNTCDELIVTELVFEGVLNDLHPSEIVAALSSLIFQEKNDDGWSSEDLPDTLVTCCETMRSIALRLGQLQKEHGLEIDPEEYRASSLKFGVVHVVYEWARGVPFRDICDLTSVQEGSIVRCITRLDELCREVRNCARVVGNPTLYRKCEEGSVLIKRDIVFASSLYVS